MPYFQDIGQLYNALDALFSRLKEIPGVREKAVASNLVVTFKYRNPEGEVWIDCTGDDIAFTTGPSDISWDACLSMEADIAHRFWLGKLNLIRALTSGDIESEGSVPKLLKLLPVVKPAFTIYPEVLKEQGLEDIIEVD